MSPFIDQTDRRRTLAQVCQKIHEISTLPQIALRVVELVNDPDTGAREIKEVMESDASLSARVLRCANSSAYARRTPITNLQQAIAYLGVKQIRNLALIASVARSFQKDGRFGTYDRKGLWKHFVSVAVCARLLAMRLRLAHFEDVFLAALLHDIGIILEDEHVHETFVRAMQSLHEGDDLLKVEWQHLGFDHTRLGEAIAAKWKLPQGVIDTIRYHHDTSDYQGRCPETVRCVEVSNFICTLKGAPSVGIRLAGNPGPAILALGLGKEDLIVLAGDLDRELVSNSILFQV